MLNLNLIEGNEVYIGDRIKHVFKLLSIYYGTIRYVFDDEEYAIRPHENVTLCENVVISFEYIALNKNSVKISFDAPKEIPIKANWFINNRPK